MSFKVINEEYTNFFIKRISENKKYITHWSEEFEYNPMNALSHSRGLFETVVQNNIYSYIISLLEDKDKKECIEYCQMRLVNIAKQMGNHTTSQTMDLIKEYEAQALAEIIEVLTSTVHLFTKNHLTY